MTINISTQTMVLQNQQLDEPPASSIITTTAIRTRALFPPCTLLTVQLSHGVRQLPRGDLRELDGGVAQHRQGKALLAVAVPHAVEVADRREAVGVAGGG